MSRIFFCGDCKYLSVTEANQSLRKEDHVCTKFNKVIKHESFHPDLPSLDVCDEAHGHNYIDIKTYDEFVLEREGKMSATSGNLDFNEMMQAIQDLNLPSAKNRIKMIVISKYPGDDPFLVEYDHETYLLMSKSCAKKIIDMCDATEQFKNLSYDNMLGRLYGVPMVEDDELCKKIVLTAIIGKTKYKELVEETTNYSPIRVHYHEG